MGTCFSPSLLEPIERNKGKGGKINDVRYLNEAKFKAGREVSHLQ